MKIPLADQIALATRLRDTHEHLAAEGVRFTKGQPDPQRDADTLNGIVLTLSLIQAQEAEFREFMATKKGQGN